MWIFTIQVLDNAHHVCFGLCQICMAFLQLFLDNLEAALTEIRKTITIIILQRKIRIYN